MKDATPFIILLAIVIALIFSPSGTEKTKTRICRIDSISNVTRYEITNEYDYKYVTDCGGVLFSKKRYEIGDIITINEQ
jgi:hypothetical protein